MKTIFYLKILAVCILAILISSFAFVIYAEVRYEDSIDYYFTTFDVFGDFDWYMVEYILFFQGIIYFIIDSILWIWHLPSFLLSELIDAWDGIKPLLLLIGGGIAAWLIISLITKLFRDNQKDYDVSSLGIGCMWVFGIAFLIPVAVICLIVMAALGLDGGGYDDSDDYYENPSQNSNPGVHWVDDYYRSDGTHVDGHWRSNPDEYEWNNLNP